MRATQPYKMLIIAMTALATSQLHALKSTRQTCDWHMLSVTSFKRSPFCTMNGNWYQLPPHGIPRDKVLTLTGVVHVWRYRTSWFLNVLLGNTSLLAQGKGPMRFDTTGNKWTNLIHWFPTLQKQMTDIDTRRQTKSCNCLSVRSRF